MAKLCTPKCYVCGNPAGWSDKTGRTTYLCSECAPSRMHVVVMTLDHDDANQSYSVATCQCGRWRNRVPWPGDEFRKQQDTAVRAHWVHVIKAAAGVAA